MAERDTHGRFLPGHSIKGSGAGRPKRAVEESLLKDLTDRLDRNGTRADILDRVIAEARAGKEWAVRFIFEYLVGKPIQRTEQRIQLADLLDRWTAGDLPDEPI